MESSKLTLCHARNIVNDGTNPKGRVASCVTQFILIEGREQFQVSGPRCLSHRAKDNLHSSLLTVLGTGQLSVQNYIVPGKLLEHADLVLSLRMNFNDTVLPIWRNKRDRIYESRYQYRRELPKVSSLS